MAEPAQLHALSREQAADIRARELAAATEKGREEGRAEWSDKLADAVKHASAVAQNAHAGELKRIGAETVQRERAAHAHGFWKAATILAVTGPILGALVAIAIMDRVQASSFNAAADFGREQVLTGAIEIGRAHV